MKRILVIEDDQEVGRQLLRCFRSWGYQPELVTSGAAALERQPGDYDLITLDIILPVINGKSVAEAYARMKADTPVVVISQANNAELRRELARFAFIRGWFSKPVDFTTLKEHVNKLFFGIKTRPDNPHPAPAAMDVFSSSSTTLLNRKLLFRDPEVAPGEPSRIVHSAVMEGMKVRKRDGGIMVKIPGGRVVLGSNTGEPQEQPEVVVEVGTFYIDKYLVTNRQYARFLEWLANTDDPRLYSHPEEPQTRDHVPQYWHEVQWSKEDYPVVGVDWFDAYAYSRWALNQLRYPGLPSEAQWERAARGPQGWLYPWGDEPPTLEHANFGKQIGHTSPVGKLRRGKSAFGLHDLAGNVWEWTLDWYDELFYRKLAEGVQDPVCTERALYRSLRGGSWLNAPEMLRATFRGSSPPTARYYHVGFRCGCPAAAWAEQGTS